MIKVCNLENDKGNIVKNQFVIKIDDKIVFQSYNSVCCIYDGTTITLGAHWDYSTTTLRHLYTFLSNYCLFDFSKLPFANSKKERIQKGINCGMLNYNDNLI